MSAPMKALLLAMVVVLGNAAGPLCADGAEPIKILNLDVLSGPFKDTGERFSLAVKFAVDEIRRCPDRC